jgi:hypothetical protein
MSAAHIAPLTAEPANAAGKVVTFHHFAHEEQVKNTDQGKMAVSRARKHPLPASGSARMSQSQLALLSLTSKKEEAIAKLRSIGMTLATNVSQLAKALAGHSAASAGSQKAPADEDGFDPWNSSILMLYTSFAEDQMNQNGQIMNGWESQQQAQNQVLQETANAEASNAKTNTTTNTACWWKSLLIGLAVFVAVLVGVAVAVATGGLAAAPVGVALAAVIGAAAVAGGAAFAASYCPTAANPNSKASAPLTQSGPDQQLIQQVSNSNIFWNTISQKTNNSITAGSQTNLVNASSNDTQVGQQAAQVIQAMGQIMQTPVAH